jgi:outer membrane biosynthesis protein TonB
MKTSVSQSYQLAEFHSSFSTKLQAFLFSLGVHSLVLFALLFQSPKDQKPEEETVSVQWVALTALGEAPQPQAMTRIVAPAVEVEQSQAQSISRVIKEETKEEKKPEKTTEKIEKQIEGKKPEKKDPPKRQIKLNDLFATSNDPRADAGARKGDARGFKEGTSTTWNESSEMSLYVSRVSVMIKRQFQVPNSISEAQRKQLKGKLKIVLNASGYVVGSVLWVEKSGNSYFDQALIRAVEVFRSTLKLTLPSQEDLKKKVLKEGLILSLSGDE